MLCFEGVRECLDLWCLWIVSQLSMYEMLVACIPIVFSYFEFPWIIIFLEPTVFDSILYNCTFVFICRVFS